MKKVLALALVVMFALSLVAPLSVSAEAVPTLSLNNGTVEGGQTVTIAATLENNPGISSIAIRVYYDTTAFSIVSGTKTIKNGGLLESFQRNAKLNYAGAAAFGSENVYDDGVVASFIFTADANIAPGDYNFTLEILQAWNEDEDPVSITTANGVVTVAAPEVTVDDFDLNMNATVDATEAQANIIFTMPEGADASKLTVTVDGVAVDVVPDSNGVVKIPTGVKAARDLGDTISYTVNYDGAEKSGSTSLKAYADALAASEDTKVAAVGTSLLNYAAAAQVAFDHEENPANLVGDPDVAPAVTSSRFDASKLNAILAPNDYSPVTYSALSVTYLTDVSLSIAFRVKDGYTLDQAADFVAANFKIDGKAVAVSKMTTANYKFVIIKIEGISIDKINYAMPITVENADGGTVSVANYLASVEAAYANDPAKAGQLNLARALYAYAGAIEALAD